MTATRRQSWLRIALLAGLLAGLLSTACQCRSEFHWQAGSDPVAESAPSDAPASPSSPLPSNAPGETVASASAGGSAAGAGDVTGNVVVRAKNEQGVPLHPADADDRVSGRLADGTAARVLETSAATGWLHVRAADGQQGWITSRYVDKAGVDKASGERAKTQKVDGAALAIAEGSPWRSQQECEAAVAQGKRRGRAANVASLATWNITWFPDRVPGGSAPKSAGTNLPWLACLIAWLDVDVLALQELKIDAHTQPKWQQLQNTLDQLTRGDWTHQTDQCPNKGRQHVGFLYDRKKVSASWVQDVASLNPTRSACGGDQRPGLGGYFRFPGGLDLHLVSVHLKSMTDHESYAKRRTALAGLNGAVHELARRDPDRDRIVLGDFNSMGCEDCSPPIAAAAERAALSKELQASSEPFELRSGAQCSHYYRGHPGLLDHFAVSSQLKELPFSVAVQPQGLCQVFSCNPLPGKEPAVYREVSDHCPLVLEIPDKDVD
jgi:endonuclease/exonuclease/phosphatase family metal-dependent hydrolase